MKLRETLNEIRIELSEIRKDLNYHIKRTDILEERQEQDIARLRKNVRPLTKIYNFLQVLGALIVVGAAIAGIIRVFL